MKQLGFFTVMLSVMASYALPAFGQVRSTDSTAIRVATEVKRGGLPDERLGEILRQQRGPRTASELKAVVDTMFSIIVGPTTSTVTNRSKEQLISALIASGMDSDGKALPSAGATLYRIARMPQVDLGKRATFGLQFLADPKEAVGHLTKLADLNDYRALTAIQALYGERLSTAGGFDALKALWQKDDVVFPPAREQLEVFASIKGWDR